MSGRSIAVRAVHLASFAASLALTGGVRPALAAESPGTASSQTAAGSEGGRFAVEFRDAAPDGHFEIRSESGDELLADCVTECSLELAAGRYRLSIPEETGAAAFAHFDVVRGGPAEVRRANTALSWVGWGMVGVGTLALGAGMIHVLECGESAPGDAPSEESCYAAVAAVPVGAALQITGLVFGLSYRRPSVAQMVPTLDDRRSSDPKRSSAGGEQRASAGWRLSAAWAW